MDTGRPAGGAGSTGRNWLALGAVVGGVLFTLAWLVLGFVSPGFTIWGEHIAPYSIMSHPISGLGLGVTAPYMNGAFVLSAGLILLGIIAAFRKIPELGTGARWVSIVLLGLTPVGALVDGVFTLEMMMPHLIGFLLAVVTPVLSFLVAGLALRRIRRWSGFAKWLIVASPVTLALVVVFFLTFDPTASGNAHGVSGLVQRVLITEVLATFAAMGWLAFRRQPG